MSRRQLFALGIVVILSFVCSAAKPQQVGTGESTKMPSPPSTTHLKMLLSDCTISIDSETAVTLKSQCSRIIAGSVTLPNGTMITTNGYSLNLMIEGGLTIEGTLTIRSFSPDSTFLNAPPKPSPPNQAGASGTIGLPGTDGVAAGPIRIEIRGPAKGILRILNRGGFGGPGGEGGNGSQGASGMRGTDAVSSLLGCMSGAGDGRSGGPGGDGGRGGPGGRAGDGGNITVIVSGNISEFLLEYDVTPGTPGEGGQGGIGGPGGEGGSGGSGSVFCSGGRGGPPGLKGKSGGPGLPGQKGISGRVDYFPPGLGQRSTDLATSSW